MPVIMVTALSLPEERIRGIEAGATDFISKPFQKRELLARLVSSLAMSKGVRSGILPQLPDALVMTEPAWKILAMSPLASVLLGIPVPGISELDFSELLDAESRQAAFAGGSFRFQVPATHKMLDAQQIAVNDLTGELILRVVVLNAHEEP